jgi:hypothetical protein
VAVVMALSGYVIIRVLFFLDEHLSRKVSE